MRILVDISHYFSKDAGRGIDRVIAKILEHMPELALREGVDLNAVAEFGDGIFREVPIKAIREEQTGTTEINKLLAVIMKISKSFLRRVARLTVPFGVVLWLKGAASNLKNVRQRNKYTPIIIGQSDVVFCPDAGWNLGESYLMALEVARLQGSKIIPLFYDLIPAKYPEFVHSHLHHDFTRWLNGILRVSDSGLAISDETAKLVKEAARDAHNDISLSTTILGADFTSGSNQLVDSVVQDFFGGQLPYIIVGTLETRKNQETVLRAFQALWRQGYVLKVCFIGTVLSLSEQLYKEMLSLPQWGTLLKVIQGINDSELAFCYSNARALIAPSFAEGFDLPVVEALHYSTPVIASDIPVHREIAHEWPHYFDASSQEELVAILKNMEKGVDRLSVESNFSWLSWQEAVKYIYTGIKEQNEEKNR